MRKVYLRMNEQSKYDIIKRVAHNEISIQRASIILNKTIRTIYNLLAKFNSFGKEGFVHGNRNRKPVSTISPNIVNFIISTYSSDTYANANYKHFQELLAKLNINISYNALYHILTKAGFISPKCDKKTKRNKNKELKLKVVNQDKLTTPELDYIAITNLDDLRDSHPRKPRAKYIGELVQQDASEEYWFGNFKTTLHAAIDDATGAILGAYFDRQETLFGYYQVFYQILTQYGIPAKFLTDRRTVFEYKRLKNPTDEKDTFTQFGYACSQLGTSIETSSIPQVKGRIERLFGTLQSRLITELKVAGISDIESANKFLSSYLKNFNSKFSTIHYYTASVFDRQIDLKRINYTLAIISNRIVDNGNSIKYKRKIYQFYDHNGLACVKLKTPCLVIKTLDNQLLACIGKDIYELVELLTNQKISKNFDNKDFKEHKYKGHKPSWFHPWGYHMYKEKMKKYQKRIA